MTRGCLTLTLSLLCATVVIGPLSAHSAWAQGLEDEARRQVDLARADFEAGAYERAINACDSALRLDPGRDVQTDAFKIKGLSLEQLGERDDARAMLLAFKSLRSGLPDDPEVEAALARMDEPKPEPEPPPQPRPTREPRPAPKPPSEKVLFPLLATIGGAGAAAAGFTVMGLSYEEAAPKLDERSGTYLGSRDEYVTLQERNKLGLQIGLAGSGVAGVGLVLTLVAAAREAPSRTAAAPAVVPWAAPSADGWVVGVAGTLP
ncbi:MAG: hypothetical protein GY898_01710 [Proteobacteria bacterium]|nr:hypothetical protein [Pseudomonadota bacterium]